MSNEYNCIYNTVYKLKSQAKQRRKFREFKLEKSVNKDNGNEMKSTEYMRIISLGW